MSEKKPDMIADHLMCSQADGVVVKHDRNCPDADEDFACDHKFIDSTVCLKCGVSWTELNIAALREAVKALRAANAKNISLNHECMQETARADTFLEETDRLRRLEPCQDCADFHSEGHATLKALIP